jgi:dipeptidyl aminopeptidase/acylaminoacyl peptidase
VTRHPQQHHRRRRASRLIPAGTLRSGLAAAGCLFLLQAAPAGEVPGFGDLPAEAVALLQAAPPATPSAGPNGRYLLLAHRHGLLERRQLAGRSLSLAGRRVDPDTHGPHAPLSYYGISVIDIANRERSEIALPRDAVIGFPLWAPDGERFAFTVTTERGVQLWIGEPRQARARRLTGGLNAVFSRPCVWLPDSRHVLCRRIRDEADSPVGAVSGRVPDARAWASTIPGGRHGTGELNVAGVEHFVESRLQIINVASGLRRGIGRVAAVTSVNPAPGQEYLLVTRMNEPYASAGRIDGADTTTEIWDISGRVVKSLSGSKRAVHWRAGRPATLVWVEHSREQDRVLAQASPFTGVPDQLFATRHRFAGLDWLEKTDAALLSEYLPGRRLTRRWLIDAGPAPSPPRQVDGHHVDVSGGRPMTARDSRGDSVLAVRGRRFFLAGETPTADGGAAPYLDEVELDTGVRRRLWTSEIGGYGQVITMFPGDAHRLLARYETADTPPDYYLVDRGAGSRVRLTHSTHPAPVLREVKRIPLSYERADGLALSATLYVPPGREADAPLPLVFWAYPKSVGAAAPPSSPRPTQRYMGAARAMKRFFLLSGYAVMDDVSMPVAASDGHANDSFVEQVVANARAAVGAAIDTGLVDPGRIAVAGHSYGAFMTANLMAHSRLFSAGAALSGAYNRTLTPFGFQTERRTLWEAPETYLAMSPLLYSDRIDAPLLLVHGTADDNAGTSPLQSLQFFEAIRGNGGVADLLLLPHEGHTYRARESVLETAAAMLDWFDRYLKPQPEDKASDDSRVALTE